MNLILVGQRASGKTLAGQGLALRVKAPFFDTDEEIERMTGMDLFQLFQEKGEVFFREAESQAVLKVKSLQDHVIAVGGGAPLCPNNQEILGRAGRVVWLDAPLESLLKRRTQGDRPPLTGHSHKEEIRIHYQERRPYYQQVAHIRLETGPFSLEEVIHELEHIWRKIPHHDFR